MANVKISELGAAAALTGVEQVPVVQGGVTVRTTVADFSSSHETDPTGAHPASAVSFTPSGLIIATDVQAALEELDAEKALISHDHSGTYVPTSGDRLWVPATAIRLGAVASLVGGAGHPKWSMPDATASNIDGTFAMPDYWATFTVDLWWTNLSAASGDVVWDIRGASTLVDTGTIALASPWLSGPLTAPAQNVAKVSPLATGQAHTDGAVAHVYLSRNGTAGGDTLAGACGVLGLMLRRES